MHRRHVLSGGAAGAPARRLEPLEHRIEALCERLTVLRPDGPGPFPTVVQLHGCGGRKAVQDRYAEAARAAGAAAIVVDSFAHRGIGRAEAYATVCTGLRLRGQERAGDLIAALEWARRQTWADAARLTAAGWSHGGWTVLDGFALQPGAQMERATGLANLPEDVWAGVRSAFLVYPYCGVAALARRSGWRFTPSRSIAIAAGRDHVVGTGASLRTLEALRQAGATLDIHLFSEATHAFDEAEARDLRVRYSPRRFAQALRLYQDLLTSREAPAPTTPRQTPP